MSKPSLLQAYHRCLGTPEIRIADYWMLRDGLGIHDYAVASTPRYFIACDWSSGTTEICNPVHNDVLGFVWSKLWQAATHYGWIIQARAHIKIDRQTTEAHVPQDIVQFILLFASFSLCFLGLQICGGSAPGLSSIMTLHIQVQAAHTCQPMLNDESVLDWDVKAPAEMPWTVNSISTVCWRKVAPTQLYQDCTNLAH